MQKEKKAGNKAFIGIVALSIAFAGALSGCAAYQPMIDTKDVNMNQYKIDLDDCNKYADNVDAGGNAALGMALGALVGALIGAAVGVHDTGSVAGYGAISGLGAGAAKAQEDKKTILQRCMMQRGYKVLS